MNQNTMKPLLVVAVVAVLGLLGFMMMRGNTTTPATTAPVVTQLEQMTATEQPMPTTDAMQVSPTAGTESAETSMMMKTINIDAGSFYYKPNQIKVKKGEKVKLVMKSADMMHDFNIDELGVKIPVTKAGETASVEFTASTTGTFEYYCGVGQHRQNGQTGTLIVE